MTLFENNNNIYRDHDLKLEALNILKVRANIIKETQVSIFFLESEVLKIIYQKNIKKYENRRF